MHKKTLLSILPPFWPKIPPLGLGYLQSFLLKQGITIDLLDINNVFYSLAPNDLKKSWLVSCNRHLEENILSIIKNNFPDKLNGIIEKILEYDIAGFSCFKSNFKTTLEIIKILKSKKPNIEIILGGPEITRQFFKGADFLTTGAGKLSNLNVAGEGELSLFEYITGRNNGRKISQFYELGDLKDLPFPEYKGLDLSLYPRRNAISILSSRGCFKKCAFCSERLLYKKLRFRPAENVIDEIAYHRSNNRIENFIFHDSTINSDLKKLEDLCDGIIKNFGSIKWEAQLYIRDDMSVDLLEKMKKSGCYNLFIGLESGCDKTLRNMNKGFNAKQALSVFKKLNKAGLFFGISIIVGYPGETKKDFEGSLNFIIRNKRLIPKIEQVNPFTYYEGTEADSKYDYTVNKDSLERHQVFIDEAKRHGFKYTNAFLGNLIEK